MKKIIIFFILISIGFYIPSCDPNFIIGIKNGTNQNITIITNRGFSSHDTIILKPDSIKMIGTTSGMYNVSANMFDFDTLEIIKKNDIVKYEGKGKIISAFKGGYLIEVK